MRKSFAYCVIGLIATVSTGGCVRAIMPTSEAEMVNTSWPAKSAAININYVDAYVNLKRMYEKCVIYNVPTNSISILTNLDRTSRLASFTGIGSHGTYLFKTMIEGMSDSRANIVTIRSKSKIIIAPGAAERYREYSDRVIGWASGEKKECS